MGHEKIIMMLLKHRRLFIDELSALTGLSRETLLERIAGMGEVVKILSEEVFVTDVLGLIELALASGVEVGKLSRIVSWRDFEKIASEILSIHRYETINNLVVRSPVRFQIDVLAIDASTGKGIVVDCKHWGTSSSSKLAEAASNHYARTVKLAQAIDSLSSKYPILRRTKHLIPMIITLTTPTLRSSHNVLIASIRELNNLLQELHYVLEEFKVKPVSILK